MFCEARPFEGLESRLLLSGAPPVADAGGPYAVKEGWTVTVDGSKSTGGALPLTYLWDLDGDGVFGETGNGATRGFEQGARTTFLGFGLGGASTQTIRLRVVGADGQSASASATVNVVNVAPSVYLDPAATAQAGQTFTYQGSFFDPGSGETFSGLVDYGDGSGANPLAVDPDRPFDLSHVYARPGTYTLTVSVADGDGATGVAAMTVNVAGGAPVFDGLAGAAVVYGQSTVTLGGRIAAGDVIPSGAVSVRLAGLTLTAPIDPATGRFSAVFDTSHLRVSGAPYTVAYDYADPSGPDVVHDASQTVTVVRRNLNVAADPAAKVYGDADPSFTAKLTGFAPGEDASDLDGDLSFTTSQPDPRRSPAGTYVIAVSGLASPNYLITYASASLTVGRRALTVAVDPATKVYGDADPGFTATMTGLAPGEDASALLGALAFATSEPAAGFAPAGVYTVTASGVSSGNYDVTFAPAELTVRRRGLTVAADAAVKVYGRPDPAFSARMSGFAPGEDASVLAGTLALGSSEPDPRLAPAGTYAITPSGLTSANYEIVFAPGALTVQRATTAMTGVGVRSVSVVVGTAQDTVSGVLTSDSVLPAGQGVVASVIEGGRVVASARGTIGTDGRFSVSLPTAALPGGVYTVEVRYEGDANFRAASGTTAFTASYRVSLLNTPIFSWAGNPLTVTVQVSDASGRSVLDPGLSVQAVSLVDLFGRSVPIQPADPSAPALTFQETSRGYVASLSTTGLRPGIYALFVSVGDDPVLHPVLFVLL